MRALRRVLALIVGMTVLQPFQVRGQTAEFKVGFKGISVGMPAERLPKTLKLGLIMYEGVHEGDFFRVTVMEGKVSDFSVIYSEDNRNGRLVSKRITLARALAEHLSNRANPSELFAARGRDGTAWGVVDIRNHISFRTVGLIARSPVLEVSYLSASAPILTPRPSDKLPPNLVEQITQLAPDDDEPSPAIIITPESRYTYASREAAVKALTEKADVALGTGRRVVALMDSAEIWLKVDSRHATAKQVFADLKTFHRNFTIAFDAMIAIYSLNKAKFKASDLAEFDEPLMLQKQIERRMRQLSAMGLP